MFIYLSTVQVRIIVMLTGLKEGNKKKADQYWPDQEQEVMEVGRGIILAHVSTSYQGTFFTR